MCAPAAGIRRSTPSGETLRGSLRSEHRALPDPGDEQHHQPQLRPGAAHTPPATAAGCPAGCGRRTEQPGSPSPAESVPPKHRTGHDLSPDALAATAGPGAQSPAAHWRDPLCAGRSRRPPPHLCAVRQQRHPAGLSGARPSPAAGAGGGLPAAVSHPGVLRPLRRLPERAGAEPRAHSPDGTPPLATPGHRPGPAGPQAAKPRDSSHSRSDFG